MKKKIMKAISFLVKIAVALILLSFIFINIGNTKDRNLQSLALGVLIGALIVALFWVIEITDRIKNHVKGNRNKTTE